MKAEARRGAVELRRPLRKPMSWRHLALAVSLAYLAVVFPLGLWLAISWLQSLATYAVIALLAFLVARAARLLEEGIGFADTPTGRWLREVTDSPGLGRLNLLLAATAAVGLLVALFRTPWLAPGFLAALAVAVLGADYRPAPERESSREKPADVHEYTLPLDPGALMKVSFEWRFAPPTRPGEDLVLRFTAEQVRLRYERAMGLPHAVDDPEGYGDFLASDTNPELASVAFRIEEELSAKAREIGLSITPFQAKWNVLSFAAPFRLVRGADSRGRRDYLRLPAEVLAEREGTPGCLVLLAAALCRQLRYEFALLAVERASGDHRLVLALPGFDYIGRPDDFFFDPTTGRRCVICEPVLKAGAKRGDEPTRAWEWSIGPLRAEDRDAPIRRIAIPAP